jgi:hypothetical protein
MLLVENGYVQDGLKLLVYLIPLFYLLIRKKYLNLRRFWLFLTGLSLLAMGNLLDFLDEFESLRGAFAANFYLFQDFFEDIIGFALGFVIFASGVYLEFIKKEEKDAVRSQSG